MKKMLFLVIPSLLLAIGCDNPAPTEATNPVPPPDMQATAPAVAPSEVPDVDLATVALTDDGWYQSYQQAVAKSEETGRPIMVDFTGSGWCIKLHDEVFSKPEFEEWASENVVLLELDYPRKTPQAPSIETQNKELMARYREDVPGFPTILFLDSNGEVIGKHGYEPGGPEAWLASADKLIGN